MTIEAVLTRWPATMAVFNGHKMACVGCILARFYTVADAVAIYGLSLPAFVVELRAAIGDQDTSPS
ncbi:MAG: hypothetical protein KC418_01275 [Anaerolineales bacterium]|nr:hypothetical protein [Anaerolineales bacterium]